MGCGEVICAGCGKEFEPRFVSREGRTRQRFCTVDCGRKYHKERRRKTEQAIRRAAPDTREAILRNRPGPNSTRLYFDVDQLWADVQRYRETQGLTWNALQTTIGYGDGGDLLRRYNNRATTGMSLGLAARFAAVCDLDLNKYVRF